MTTLRLLADDLTGALDTAAEFVPLTGPVRVFWHGGLPATLPPSAAIDSGTRELPHDAAAARVAALTPHLAGPAIAYKKIDSLLRGATLAELAACLRAGPWRACILAPAFPFQGRITADGIQLARGAGGTFHPAGDIHAGLRAEHIPVHPGRLAAPLPDGISVFDARTDADLAAIAAFAVTLTEPVLLAGTGGLAQAMAAGHPAPAPRLHGPVLGLFGSDQDATARQLAACGPAHLRLREGESPARVAAALATGTALVSLDLPPGAARDHAAQRIAAAFDALAAQLPPPGTLMVAGGETLRALCLGLGTEGLDLIGRLQPGVPVSRMVGGRWHGVTVVSKSGAFGGPNLLRDILPSSERVS